MKEGLIFMACFAIGIGISVGVKAIKDASHRDAEWQQDAAAHGKAEYLTAENGKQIWRWKP